MSSPDSPSTNNDNSTSKLSKDIKALEDAIKAQDEIIKSYEKKIGDIIDSNKKLIDTIVPNNKMRYIFLDFGANNGDSSRTFLKEHNPMFTYDFPRPEGIRYDEAEIYLFEANPRFNENLLKAKADYTNKYPKLKTFIYPMTAVYVEDTVLNFYIDDATAQGSSLSSDHRSVVGKQGVPTTCVDVGKFILKNFLPQDFVVVKVDIEGAEYDIIPHLYKTKAYLNIDYLLVEYHDFAFPPGTRDQKDREVKAALAEMEKFGVKHPDYKSES